MPNKREKRPALAAVLQPFEPATKPTIPIRPFYSVYRDNDHLQTKPETQRFVSGHAFRRAEQTRNKRPALAAVLLPFEPTTKPTIPIRPFYPVYRDNDHLQTKPETQRLVSGHAFRRAEQT